MNQYELKVKIRNAWYSTSIGADSSTHAKLLAQYIYGFSNVSTPSPTHAMKFNEFATLPLKPKTPNQQRIDALQKQKDTANNALKNERDRQKLQKAQQQIANIKMTTLEK